MNIGKYKLQIITSGMFALDGGAMFGIIPKNLWERSNPPDEQNRITLATRHLVLTSGSRKILIDTGMGAKWDEKSKDIYKISQPPNAVLGALTEAGINPDEITDVILTHLHFDHTGGSTISEGGKLIPAFRNAKYYVQKKNFDWGVNPSDRDRGSYIKDNFEPLASEGVLEFIEENDSPFDDEISFHLVNGHTFAQQLVKISDGTETIFYCGDLFPTSSHIPLPYIMGYDLQPLVTLAEKKVVLKEAVEKNWWLFFEHDPATALAKVELTPKGYKAGEKRAGF